VLANGQLKRPLLGVKRESPQQDPWRPPADETWLKRYGFTAHRRGARPFISGWVGIAVLAVLVVVARGSDELPFALVLAGVAVAVCAWYRMSSGKAAVIVGLLLGALLGLDQLASAKSARGRTWPLSE
jgi:hypothetical protein